MDGWNSAHRRPAEGSHVWIKGTLRTGKAPDEPFTCQAVWNGGIWRGVGAGWFPPEVFEVTNWKEFNPGEETVAWNIAGLGDARENAPLPRAFFTWTQGDHDQRVMAARSEDYSEQELEAEIRRRRETGTDVPAEFSEALEWMRKARE